ncbi:MAG: Na+/H+ antiporter subunit G [Alphaproteobacteria bacterium]|nr:Na+/H+ antiporter subunit G [Alphaproteobacteria bacterium]|tara:strand:- start:2757 stop:3071 length:315 start_codon:yes stop_codon:yes gene_type:complete
MYSIGEWLILAGALLIFIAGLGIVRMPDLFLRMHASAKAGTLGTGLLLMGAAVYYATLGVVVEILVATFFLLLTAPVAFHLIGRAAFRHKTPMHPKTQHEQNNH